MPTIEVTDMQLAEFKEKVLGIDTEVKEIHHYEDMIGEKLYFRTVTYHLVGEVTAIVGRFACLKNASWVADSGRFMNAIKDGTLSEVEPVGKAFVNLETVTDFFPWRHSLPKDQK